MRARLDHAWRVFATGLSFALFGIGGGVLVVPGLVLVLGMNQRLAHGTSLAAVLPISISSMLTPASARAASIASRHIPAIVTSCRLATYLV